MYKVVAYLVLIFFVCTNCNKKKEIETILISQNFENIKTSWDTLIKDSTKINLNLSGLSENLSQLSQIEFLKSGRIVIPDGYSKTLFILEEDGTLQTKIDRNGRGPGEFTSISRITVDQNKNIYLFDPSQKKMIVYYSPNYTSFDEYITKNYISRFAVLSGPEEVITYSPYTEYLFNKINLKTDENIESAILPKDKNFKIWMARIQSGGIVYSSQQNTLYGLYPENLIIYKFTISLDLKAKILPSSDKIFYEEFPGNLDPYGYDLRHEEWWSGFNHLSRIKLLGDSRIIISYYGKSPSDESTSKVFLNIYDIEKEKIIAKNVKLPTYANLAGVRNGYLYISYKAHLNENNEEIDFKLYKYSLTI